VCVAVLAWSFGTSLGLTLITAGQTLPLLRRTVLLAPRRPDLGIQGLPVNQTAGRQVSSMLRRTTRRSWSKSTARSD
jgi:hypothetical protein